MELAPVRRTHTLRTAFLVVLLAGYPCGERAFAGEVEGTDSNEWSIPTPRGDGGIEEAHVVRGGWTEYDGRTNEGKAITSDGSEVAQLSYPLVSQGFNGPEEHPAVYPTYGLASHLQRPFKAKRKRACSLGTWLSQLFTALHSSPLSTSQVVMRYLSTS